MLKTSAGAVRPTMLDPQPIVRNSPLTNTERGDAALELNLDSPVRDSSYRQQRASQARQGADLRESVRIVFCL